MKCSNNSVWKRKMKPTDYLIHVLQVLVIKIFTPIFFSYNHQIINVI